MNFFQSILQFFIDIFTKLEPTLQGWAADLGIWFYVIIFAIVFCETGLVIMPFLPGDSLLFALGALAVQPDSKVSLLAIILVAIIAGILGDAVNYAIGHYLGPKVFSRESSWLLNKKHINKAQAFYEKYGNKTIVLARFVPIVRTFAPFVAGIGNMKYTKFAVYNVFGAIAWVLICTLAGVWFGNLPWVKKNFELVLVAIVFVSVLPMLVEIFLAWRKSRAVKPTEPPSV